MCFRHRLYEHCSSKNIGFPSFIVILCCRCSATISVNIRCVSYFVWPMLIVQYIYIHHIIAARARNLQSVHLHENSQHLHIYSYLLISCTFWDRFGFPLFRRGSLISFLSCLWIIKKKIELSGGKKNVSALWRPSASF